MVERHFDRPHDFYGLPGQRTAVRITQHHRLRATAHRRLERFERVSRVGLVAVEKVLSVVDHTPALRPQIGQALLDDAQVVVERRPQHLGDVQRPRFADHGANRCPRVEHGLDVRVVFRITLRATSGAERGDEGRLPLDVLRSLKEFCVLRVGAGPAALDESDA